MFHATARTLILSQPIENVRIFKTVTSTRFVSVYLSIMVESSLLKIPMTNPYYIFTQATNVYSCAVQSCS